jgi:dynein heavy chain
MIFVLFLEVFHLGVLQNYARKYTIPIDKLAFEFDILQEDTDMMKKPDDGAYIKGLFLEGARWNKTSRVLDESLPKVLFDVLPIIWLRPGIIENFAVINTYSCPVYKVNHFDELNLSLFLFLFYRQVLDVVYLVQQVIRPILCY